MSGFPSERDLDRAGAQLPLPAWKRKVLRRAVERDDALTALALAAAPEKEACRANLEPAEAAHLDLQRALPSALSPECRSINAICGEIYRFAAVRRLSPSSSCSQRFSPPKRGRLRSLRRLARARRDRRRR